MNIFKIEDEQLVIDKEECRMIPEFNKIIVRDQGGKMVGDSNGRKKFFAFAELMYLYLVHNPLSMYRDLGDVERKEKAIKHIGVSDKWKVDKHLAAAEKVYVSSLFLSGTYKAFINANRAIYSIGQDIDLFNEQKIRIRTKLLSIQDELLECKDEVRNKDLIELETSLTTRLMTITKNIQLIVEKLNDNYSTLKKLKERLAEEENMNKQEIRGGGTLNNREEG